MPVSHLFEDFGSDDPAGSGLRILSEEALEDHRLAAFEQGYSAGWEDAMAARDQERARVSAALARTLEDLSFTYHEVRGQLLKAIEPVFRSLTAAVLPEVMMRGFGHHVVEKLGDLSRERMAGPVRITVATGEGQGLRELLAPDLALRVTVAEDPALDEGAAIIRIGEREHEIDAPGLTAALSESIGSFFEDVGKEAGNG